MTTFRGDVPVPVELDRRTYADNRRDQLESNYQAQCSRLHHPTGGLHSSTSVLNPSWSSRLDNGRYSPFGYHDGDDWYDEMSRRFNERRRRWDEDVRRMRDEFFTLSPHDPLPSSVPLKPLPRRSEQPVSTAYERLPDGNVQFVANFEVSDFNPSDLKVIIRDDQLVVTARSEVREAGHSSSKEYTRSVDLPRGFEEHAMKATVSSDRVLSVTCPMRPPPFTAGSTVIPVSDNSVSSTEPYAVKSDSSATNSSSSTRYNPTSRNFFNTTSPRPIGITSSLSSYQKPNFRLEIPVDREYSPTDLQIRTLNQRIYINARHEERGLSRTAVREFSKEYDIPDDIDPESLEAKFENGMLFIEAKPK